MNNMLKLKVRDHLLVALTSAILVIPALAQKGKTTTSDSSGALTLQISEPNNTPVLDDNFTFNVTADPGGAVTVTASGTTNKPAENANLQWYISSIAGSTLSKNPSTAKGANVVFTYTRLPATNSAFGAKWLTLTHPKLKSTKKKGVKIFFDGNTAANNHPGAGSGVTPNWYFYWSQTGANYGTHIYDGNGTDPTIEFRNNTWVGVMTPASTGDYTPPIGDVNNAKNLLNGIDNFAHAVRHEGRHCTTSNIWYPNNYDDTIDADGDWMPNAQEATLGGTATASINGGPFTPGNYDTDNDGYRDEEDYNYATATEWNEGDADHEDWANPGHNYN